MIGSNVPTIRSAVNGTTLATTLTGLNPYTQYSCYLTANTSVGEGRSSAVITSRTTESGNKCKHEIPIHKCAHRTRMCLHGTAIN